MTFVLFLFSILFPFKNEIILQPIVKSRFLRKQVVLQADEFWTVSHRPSWLFCTEHKTLSTLLIVTSLNDLECKSPKHLVFLDRNLNCKTSQICWKLAVLSFRGFSFSAYSQKIHTYHPSGEEEIGRTLEPKTQCQKGDFRQINS